MLRGLEGRRIALASVGAAEESVTAVRTTLSEAGAEVEMLGEGESQQLHGGRFAALVIVGAEGQGSAEPDAALLQLVREFLVSEKPVAVHGAGLHAVLKAGGAAGRSLAAGSAMHAAVSTAGGTATDTAFHADGCLLSAPDTTPIQEFARSIVRQLAQSLEESAVDDAVDQSFPASDPPSTTPVSAGSARTPEQRGESR